MSPSISDKYTYRSVEGVTETPSSSDFWELTANYYWVVHPEKGLAFYDPQGMGRRISPQCNANEEIVKRLAPSGHEVRHIPAVWLRHDCADYR